MRVTFVCPSGAEPIGGVAALYEFANGLARRGHEIHLVHLPMWGRRIDTIDQLDRYGFEADITHHLPGGDPAALPPADVVFGTGAPARLGLPVLLVQGIDMLHQHLERQAMRTPCLKICVASWLVDAGVRYGVPPEQMHVVPMGIDHDRYRTTVALQDRPPTIAMLHSTHAAKGWDVGLEALHEARDQVPEARAKVFGTVAPAEPLPGWIEFHRDPTPEVLVQEIYNQAQVFVQPSHYEGFGFTAVEAMACGAALVTTDNGGSTDYAIPGETALVTSPGDGAGLGARAADLLVDGRRRTALAEAGRDHVQRFNWDTGAALLERHLQRYVADPAAFQHPPRPDDDLATTVAEGGGEGDQEPHPWTVRHKLRSRPGPLASGGPGAAPRPG